MKRKIAVYCTGGTQLGFGHFFRSRALVNSASDDLDLLLVAVISSSDRKVFDNVHNKVLCETEEDALAAIVKFSPDIVVLDTVYCSTKFFSSIKKDIRITASISPIFNHMENVDYLFTRNPDTADIENVTVFKGLQYTIFNENCTQIPDEVYLNNLGRDPLPIGIAMGGGGCSK